jgi:hypothetical protein
MSIIAQVEGSGTPATVTVRVPTIEVPSTYKSYGRCGYETRKIRRGCSASIELIAVRLSNVNNGQRKATIVKCIEERYGGE